MKAGFGAARRPFGVILGLTVSMLAACSQSPDVKSAKFLAAGKALMQKKDAPRAILQFKNAIQATPDKPEPYFQLGDAYSATKDFSQALDAYYKTLELDPHYPAAKLRIAQMMVASSDPAVVNDAEADLKELLKNNSSPEALNTLAYAELRLGEIDSALTSLNKSLQASPENQDTASLLAADKLLGHDYAAAEAILQEACKKSPKPAQARRALGDFYVDQKRFPDAETQFRAALAIDPKFAPALLDLAKLQIAAQKNHDADDSFQKLAKFPEYRSMHAIFLFEQGQRDQAIRELETLSKQNPDDRAVRSNLVIAYRALGRPGDADQVLARALKINPKDADALLQRGEIAIGSKDYTTAEADLNQVVSLRPDQYEVHYLLAKLHQARGEVLTYRQELGEALRIKPNLVAVRVELARSLSSTGAGAKTALTLLDAAPDSQKNLQSILIQRNWAYWTLQDYAAMRKGIDLGLSRERTPDLLLQFGLWKLHSGDAPGARALVEEALKLNPNDLRSLDALSQTYLAEKNTDMALKKAKEFAGQHASSAPAQDFLGVLLMANGNREQARTAFEAARAADPTYTKSDFSLVQVDFSESKFEEAKKRLEGILASDGNNTTARLWLGNIEIVLNHSNTAIQHFRQVVQNDPDNAQAFNNLAYLLTEANNPDEALIYAQKAVNLKPDKSIYSDTMGWTLYRKGRYADAVSYLERASADKSADVVWKYHLAMAYVKAGDLERGRAALANALKLNPNVPEAKAARDMFEGKSRP